MQKQNSGYGSTSSDSNTSNGFTVELEIKPLLYYDYKIQKMQEKHSQLWERRNYLLLGLFLILALLLSLAFLLPRRPHHSAPPRRDERLIFFDDFNFLDRSIWNVEQSLYGGGNMEFQYYIDSPVNVFVKNGSLCLRPDLFEHLPPMRTIPDSDVLYNASDVMYGTCQPYPDCATFVVPNCWDARFDGCMKVANYSEGRMINPVTSGRVNTKHKFSFKYGRVEWRAKICKGDWLWPALWLLPENDAYGIWPASGEIDVMEARGNNITYRAADGTPLGLNSFGSTLHFGQIKQVEWGWLIADGWMNAHKEIYRPHGDFSQDWHIYGLVWTEDQMYTYVVYPDGTEHLVLDLRNGFKHGFYFPPLGMAGEYGWETNPYKHQRNNAPFDQDFYLVMNVAVGGQNGNLGYWHQAPWMNCSDPDCHTINKFWESRSEWYPTWLAAGDDLSLAVDWVKVWQ